MTYASILTREHFEGKTPDPIDQAILKHIDQLPINPQVIKESLGNITAQKYLDSVIEARLNRYNKGEITRESFVGKEKDILDVIILSELNDEPLRTPDIIFRLEQDGIPGYSEQQIEERLKFYVELHEAIKTDHGLIKFNDTIADEDQLGLTFMLCRRPAEKLLKLDPKPNHHSYIEDGISRKRSQAIPVPKGSRVFVCVYCYYSRKGCSAYFSHIYAYRYKDGPIQSLDYWAHMTEEI